jgi:hypothetical protein
LDAMVVLLAETILSLTLWGQINYLGTYIEAWSRQYIV